MLHKGVNFQARMLSVQNQAHGMARNFTGNMNHVYHAGRNIAGYIDRVYGQIKRLHDNHAKAIANASPELAQVAKKAMDRYEVIRKAVMGSNEAGERISNILAN